MRYRPYDSRAISRIENIGETINILAGSMCLKVKDGNAMRRHRVTRPVSSKEEHHTLNMGVEISKFSRGTVS